MRWHIPYSPLLILTLRSTGGGGAWPLVPLSYVSDSGVPKICQRGEGVVEGCPPSHGREIMENYFVKMARFVHKMSLLGVGYVK